MTDPSVWRGGIPIYRDVNCVRDEVVPRTWRERLFSWPWRPLQATRTVRVPSWNYVACDVAGPLQMGPVLVCHPAAYDELKAAVKRYNQEREP